MKYLFYLLLLIGTAKGQDSTLHLTPGLGHVETLQFMGADSVGICGYQKPDSPFVVIGDSARLIKVLVESLDHTGKFRVRWPKKNIDHFIDTIIIRHSTDMPWEPYGITGHPDETVKWKPYYQKKKHHKDSPKYFPLLPDTHFGIYPDGDTSWFMDYQKRHPLEFTDSARNAEINGAGIVGSVKWRAITKPTIQASRGLTLTGTPTITIHSGYVVRWDTTKNHAWVRDNYSDLEWTRPYPWWKKLLWVVLGVFIAVVIFVIVELIRAKEIFQFEDPYPSDYDQLGKN